jgi:hypothetical protein
MAPLGNDMLAILAGDDRTKTVSLVSLESGALLRTFGVTREATDLSTVGPNGPLLLAIGGTAPDGHTMGAVETWSLDGVKQRVVPMPLRADNVTRAIDNLAYVLVEAGSVRAAIPLDTQNLTAGKAIPLDGSSRELEQCLIGTTTYLIYNTTPSTVSTGTVAVRDLRTGVTTRSTIVADDPTCISGAPGIYAIEKSLVNDKIAILDVPGLQEQSNLAAESDTAALNETLDHRLLALDITGRVSTVEEYPADTLGPVGQLR